MARNRKREDPQINSSSMADIAFLLLIFFLVTTTIANDRGLFIPLPPDPETMEDVDIKIPERNLFKIQINSADRLLVEGEPLEDVSAIKPMIKEFVLNYGADPESSDSPEEAIVSLKTDRGTTQARFIEVLDEIQGAYYDIYADRAGVTNQGWRKIIDNLNDPENRRLYDVGRGMTPEGKPEFPMNISIAEPTKIGG
ncbi:ExbD/TolR family protein [Fulvivirga sedimenti]|uniref:Biopolymer transporter ExbD n=1 Tax=Fulvivirga sedimenti TaxID=2879465 RepID=A0A9X1HUK3_9BACT|nr:biopolymer transporter ExbD [Fulvivirga sedimenti]MCA6075210.1 biopolymer transporter ExbD [Fulvivirga sedimenti]MCA6076387.1 biopolymer transporter ExbD [Fulvivirga sedimenti]MCA6077515.1 biopolymer transporter ExbD [Fulvivirga sedimenti]